MLLMDTASWSRLLVRSLTVALVTFLLINVIYLIAAYFQLDVPFQALGWRYGAFTLNDELAGIPFNSSRGLRLVVIFTAVNLFVGYRNMKRRSARAGVIVESGNIDAMRILLLLTTLWGCVARPQLPPLAFEEVLALVANGADPDGAWRSELAAHYADGRGGDLYLADDGRVARVVARPLRGTDLLLRVVLAAQAHPPAAVIPEVAVDCDSTVSLLRSMYAEDGYVRRAGAGREELVGTTYRIQARLVALLDRCPWPEAQTKTIWWLVHHNMLEHAAYYYPALRQRVGTNGLSAYNLAYLEDRLLTRRELPQLYGTQRCDGRLCPIFEPDSVNLRRRAAGFFIGGGPDFHSIESECSLHGLDWPTEKARMEELQR